MSTGRRITTAETVPPPPAKRALAAGLAALAAAYVALLVCAAVPSSWGFLVAAVAVVAVEFVVAPSVGFAGWALRFTELGVVARGALRAIVFVLFAARTLPAEATVFVAVAAVLAASLRVLHVALDKLIAYERKPPVAARGLALDLPPVPPAPHAWWQRVDLFACLADLVGAATLACAALAARQAIAEGGFAALVVISAAAPTVLGWHAVRLRRLALRRRVTDAVWAAVDRLRPEVVAYLGNEAEWRYQLEMWLPILEAMPQRVLLLVRDHDVLRRLAPTSLPVASVPGADALMAAELPGLRAVLYVGNNPNNLHLLRRPGLRNVFIGHGDSDKAASANPITRVYHEVWVAGPAGRARYAPAGVELPDAAFVEVGRPQLGDLPRRPEAVPQLTVLYAPTWEGWGEDEFHCSLPHLGVQIVRALLARPGVRVMYRPHPRTGDRDPATRRAHLQIVELLRAAGADAAAVEPPPAAFVWPDDLLDLAAAGPARWSRTEHDAAVERWTAAYWAARPGHRVLTPPAPDLHACFTVADALIADISSVISDFLAADRPYAVVSAGGSAEHEVRERWPSTAGGFVLGPDLAALHGLLAAARGDGDPTAAARARTRHDLLGPRTADPVATFRAELDRVCARTVAEPSR